MLGRMISQTLLRVDRLPYHMRRVRLAWCRTPIRPPRAVPGEGVGVFGTCSCVRALWKTESRSGGSAAGLQHERGMSFGGRALRAGPCWAMLGPWSLHAVSACTVAERHMLICQGAALLGHSMEHR